jgi:hypothetical protein
MKRTLAKFNPINHIIICNYRLDFLHDLNPWTWVYQGRWVLREDEDDIYVPEEVDDLLQRLVDLRQGLPRLRIDFRLVRSKDVAGAKECAEKGGRKYVTDQWNAERLAEAKK